MKWLMRMLGERKKRKAGFTLVELMIVVIIVGILAAAAVPIYKFAVSRAYTSEAKASLGAIRAAELVHKAEHGEFLAVLAGNIGNQPTDPAGAGLGIEVANNTWFDAPACFWVESADPTAGFVAKCEGTPGGHTEVSDIRVSLNQDGEWGTWAAPAP